MTVLRSPGSLSLAATDGMLPARRERGFENEIAFNAGVWGGKSPVVVPYGATPDRWLAAFEPWWQALSDSFAPFRMDFARFTLSSTPFAGSGVRADGMDEAWKEFGAGIRGIVAATGFWSDDGDGLMQVHLNVKFYDAPGEPSERSSYLNLSRDLRLQRYLRPFVVERARRLTATCPDWFSSFHEMAFTLLVRKPSARETFEARCAMPEVSRQAGRKIEHSLTIHPPGWGSGKVKAPPPKRIYPGWEPLVEDVSYLETFSHGLGDVDSWEPAWVVYQREWHHGEMSCALIQEVNDWVAANAKGRNAHTFSGLYEFDLEEDALAFVARWGDVPPDEPDLF